MNKTEIHRRLLANREAIIREDKQGIPIIKIAQEYGVSFTTIYSLLKKWGAKKRDFRRKYFKPPKDIKKEREEKIIAFRKRLSPELLAKMNENTRINNQFIKFYKVVDTAKDNYLVRNLLRKARAIK